MNNNQFKRFIREKIEQCCKENNLFPIYIDTTANNRIYYVYNKDYKIEFTLSNWIGNNEYSLSVSYNKDEVVNIANKDYEISGTYMKLDTLLKKIKDIIGRR